MRPVPTFPQRDWQDFQALGPLAALMAKVPELSELKDWPTPESWQDIAIRQDLWSPLGHRLFFTLEEKLGQRAKRRQSREKQREVDRLSALLDGGRPLIPPPLPAMADGSPQRSGGRSYEASILEKREIPTRAHNLHDFFNALIWVNFPLAKYALHKRAHTVQTEWSRVHSIQKRCPLADRLTCFDEGGIVLEIPDGLERSWVEALIQSRDDSAKQAFTSRYSQRFTLFGHGMMEVMMKGKGDARIHASCIILGPGSGSRDDRLARYLDAFDENSPDHGAIDVSWLLGRA